MFELLGLLALIAVGAVIFGVIAIVGGLLKLVFKIALVPVALLFKGLFFLIGALVVLFVVGPLVFGLGLIVLIPLLLIGGVIWAGIALVT
ncbi:MAG: hypothetical protein AB1Z65_11285 [Candidatus Sulfomarinibacteraceae bacterium]